jgi:hypothetical protein
MADVTLVLPSAAQTYDQIEQELGAGMVPRIFLLNDFCSGKL